MSVRQQNEEQIRLMQKNLKELRKGKGWSVEELSKISGINEKILTDIEAGEDFSIEILLKLCFIYGLKLHEIFLALNNA